MHSLSYDTLLAHLALSFGSIKPKPERTSLSTYRFPEYEDRLTHTGQFTCYGICALCGKRTTKAAMTRRLENCLAKHETSQARAVRFFRLRIEDAKSPIFWMNVEIRANATLEDLEDFLRQRWLVDLGCRTFTDCLPLSHSASSHSIFLV